MSRLLVGLTGGLASGKSTVADLLREEGFTVVDADRLVAELYAPGEPGAGAVREILGDDAITPEGAVDKTAVAERIFADDALRHRLERAVHALVRRRFAERAAKADGIVVLEATLLVEAGQDDDVDVVVTVEADEAVRLARAVARGMSEADARARLAAQGDGAKRRARADRVIRNDGTLEDLHREVASLAADLRALVESRQLYDERRRLWPRPSQDQKAELAALAKDLGTRLNRLELRRDALAATGEAVELYRQLARERPGTFRPHLASNLYDLSIRLGKLGQSEDALDAIREAVELYRRLNRERPEDFRSELALSLDRLGIRLGELGQHEKALGTTQEAVERFRQLARERDAFRSNLATSLNNLALRLSELGRREKALDASREAVELYRQLSREQPEGFRHEIAVSLNNLAIRLSELGRLEEALEAMEETVDLRRRLAADRPEAFRSDLARSLNNLGYMLNELGRREDAHDATREAVVQLRPVFLDHPAAYCDPMKQLVESYLERAEAAGRDLDDELLAPIRALLPTYS